jgi:SAM-dependent methyltransferase
MKHATEQLAYFASINHAERFRWQTEDAFVKRREHETLRPLADALRKLRQEKGTPLRVFESGCGEGVNLVQLRQLGLTEDDATFVGIDLSTEAVAEAKRHGLDAHVGNGLHIPFADASFDAAFCRDVFHHLQNDGDRRAFFSEMQRVVHPGGFVVAIEPNPLNAMIFGLSLAIREESGLRSIREGRMKRLFPGCSVTRVAPSAAWRFWLHFYSPLCRHAWTAGPTRVCLAAWEALCRVIAPSVFWSYRVYTWKK